MEFGGHYPSFYCLMHFWLFSWWFAAFERQRVGVYGGVRDGNLEEKDAICSSPFSVHWQEIILDVCSPKPVWMRLDFQRSTTFEICCEFGCIIGSLADSHGAEFYFAVIKCTGTGRETKGHLFQPSSVLEGFHKIKNTQLRTRFWNDRPCFCKEILTFPQKCLPFCEELSRMSFPVRQKP